MGWLPETKRVEHIGVGLMCGEDGKKFKTRSGDTIKLVDLLDEAVKRAKDELVLRSDEIEDIDGAAANIGLAAVKYFDLRQVRSQPYKFSFERVLDPKGNTAVYLLYGYARICAIFRKAGISEAELNMNDAFQIKSPEERAIIVSCLGFSDLIESILIDLQCHRICDFLWNLTKLFSDFYQKFRVVGSEDQNNRLIICFIVKQYMSVAFDLLGINPLVRI